MFPLSSPAFSFSAVNVTHRQQLQLFTKRWPPRSCLMSTRRGAKRSAPDTRSTLKLKSEPKPVYCAPSVSEVVSSIEEELAAIGDPKHAVQAERYLRGVARKFRMVYGALRCIEGVRAAKFVFCFFQHALVFMQQRVERQPSRLLTNFPMVQQHQM